MKGAGKCTDDAQTPVRRRQFLGIAAGVVLAGVGAIVGVDESSKGGAPAKVQLDDYYDSALFRNKSAAIQAAYRIAAARGAVLECGVGRV